MRFDMDGVTVNAATGGSMPTGTRPLAVLVHGAGMDRTVWSMMSRRIVAAGHDVLAVDLPGHGASSGPAPDTISGFAEWLAAVIRSRPQGAAHLIGHSMGALIALETAASHPDLASTLTLIGVAAPMLVHPQLQAAADDRRHLAFDLVIDWSHAMDIKLGRHANPGMVTTGYGLRTMERGPAGALASDLRAVASYGGARAAARAVRCRSLVLVGMRDRMTPPGATTAVIGDLEDVTTIRLAANGHGMMTEAPDTVVDAITAFLVTG